MNWKVPHDDKHQFLTWGPRDDVFNAWVLFLIKKGVEFDIAGSYRGDRWTIYKHKLFTGKLSEPFPSKCCPLVEDE